MFERTDAAPSDDHGLACIGGDGGQMDFAQVYCRLIGAWSLLCLGDLTAHMQFKAAIPDQGTSPTLLWKVKRQTNGLAPSAHRQEHPSWLDAHGLSGPVDRIKPLGPPGVFH